LAPTLDFFCSSQVNICHDTLFDFFSLDPTNYELELGGHMPPCSKKLPGHPVLRGLNMLKLFSQKSFKLDKNAQKMFSQKVNPYLINLS